MTDQGAIGGSARATGRGRTRAVTAACALLLAPFAAWTLMRYLGLDSHYPMAQLVAFTPYIALAAPVPVLVAAVSRRWWITGLAAVVAVALAAAVLPRSVTGQDPTSDQPSGVAVRLLSANMLAGGADAGELVALVRREHVDVLALQEYTPAAEVALRAAGLSELLPYRAADAQPGVTGSALYARLPLRQSRLRTLSWGFGQMTATLDIPGGQPLTVESVHPCAPASRAAIRAWSDGLASQPAAGPDALRVLIGDFNATLDHSQLRRLLASGYRDAASAVGAGLVPTWPYAGARARVTPKVTLDHAFADERIAVTGYEVFTIANTDHRPIFAELVVPAGADR